MCGTNALDTQWCDYIFILCYTHLKLSLLLYKTVLVTFLLGSTVKIDHDTVLSAQTIYLLGQEYDSNFSTAPYLSEISHDTNTHAAVIWQLSFGMPNYLLKPFANGILMGKILAAAPAAIPIRMCMNEKPYLAWILNDIDKSIRSTARTITRTKLTVKVKSEIVLWKEGLRSLKSCRICQHFHGNYSLEVHKGNEPTGSLFWK